MNKNKPQNGWSDYSWNPVTGCTQISPGCDRCYAKDIVENSFMKRAFPNGFDVTMHPKRLDQPRKEKESGLVFVCSMSDLFHGDVTREFIQQVWDSMLEAPHHDYAILTKRPGRMKVLVEDLKLELPRNIHIGVSVENQEYADKRMPILMDIPTHSRWVSAEPLLEPVDFSPWMPNLNWIVVGGEGGTGFRPYDNNWARPVLDLAIEHGTLFYHKGGNHRSQNKNREIDGVVWSEKPDIFG